MNGGLAGPRASKHLGYLDGLRALAAVYVMLCHAFLEVDFRHQRLSDFAKCVLQIFFFGHFAVDVFIVLSGFCLMLPVVNGDGGLRGGTVHFLKRRSWRILPPYYAALLLSLTLIGLFIHQKTGTHWDVSLPVTLKSVLTHLFLVQDMTGDEANINHVFWSISVEWRIYFFFPLLVFLWPRLGSVGTTATALVLSYLGYLFCAAYFGNPFAAHYVGLFTMGMFAANVMRPTDRGSTWLSRLPWHLITALLTGIVFLMFFPRLWDGPPVRVYVADYMVGAWSMSLLVVVSRNERSWIRAGLSFRPLVFVGTFAYSVYLIHAPLLQILWQYPFASIHSRPLPLFAALTLVGAPVILGLSYGFFLAFERPFLKKGKPRKDDPLVAATVLQPAP